MPPSFTLPGFVRVKGFVPSLLLSVSVVALVIVSGAFFFHRGKMMMETQLKEKLKSTAAAAAMQFAGNDLLTLGEGDTMDSSPVLKQTVETLQRIRETIPNIRFAYIMKQTEDPALLMFLADADLALSDEELDHDKSGTVEPDEESSIPGELYDWSEFPKLGVEAFLHPTSDDHVANDQWGGTISGYAPIHDQNGKTVAVLGLDMAADEYIQLTQSIFSPVAFLLIALATICLGGGSLLLFWKRRFETLEKLEIERSGLLRLAFHQLGGPLTIISWSLQELEESGPESIHRTVINIEEGVRRLNNILKTLKDADLIHAGRLEYKPELVSLTSILKDVSKDGGVRLASRKQKLELQLTDTVTMDLDPKLIAGVATELLNNAIDFSPDGATITIRSRREGKTAFFEIEDRGCGIPKQDLARIFGEFTRGSNATRFKADGIGLGLYIVEGIIKRAGGKINIRSTEGKGTVVTVRLPIA